jgi:2-oxoglutarate ferredoxin oxidoreductase subunit gamma
MITKILLAGEGGQGIQTIAKALSKAAAASGFECTYIPSFGVEQRGTPSVAFITISDKEIRYPRFDEAEYAIILQHRAVHATVDYITTNTKVIFDSSTTKWSDLPKIATHLFGISSTKYAYEKFTPRAFNMIVLGKISKIANLPEDKVWETIMALLGKKFKTKEIEEKNHEAYLFGREAVFETKEFTSPTFVPSTQTLISKGHDKKAEIIPERCKGCGICIFKCPVKALSFGDELGVYATPTPQVDLERCIGCGNCYRFCPDSAIRVDKTV